MKEVKEPYIKIGLQKIYDKLEAIDKKQEDMHGVILAHVQDDKLALAKLDSTQRITQAKLETTQKWHTKAIAGLIVIITTLGIGLFSVFLYGKP